MAIAPLTGEHQQECYLENYSGKEEFGRDGKIGGKGY